MAIKRKRGTEDAGKKSKAKWVDAPTSFDRRCVFMLIYGDTGTGRTSLALTAPGPIALMHTTEKLDGVVSEYAGEKSIRMANFGGVFSGKPQKIAEKASKHISDFKACWYDAVGGWAHTAIVDTATEGWELLRLARFGTVTPQGQIAHMYGPVNAEWRSIWKTARMQDFTNVIAVEQTKDEYKRDKSTGRTVRAGQKEIPFIADVIIRTSRTKDRGFMAEIQKGWWNAHVEGLSLEDEAGTDPEDRSITFSMIMALITETDEEDWT